MFLIDMKELSLYLFLCHSLQSGTVWLGIMWQKPLGIIGMQQVLDCKFPVNSWFPWPCIWHRLPAPDGQWEPHREWLSKIKHPINSGRGCQCRKNTLRALRKRPGYAALLMNWNPKHSKPWTAHIHTRMRHGGLLIPSRSLFKKTEAQVGLANYYKFM